MIRRRKIFNDFDRRLWKGEKSTIPRGWEIDEDFTNKYLSFIDDDSSLNISSEFLGETDEHILDVSEIPSHAHNILHGTVRCKPSGSTDDRGGRLFDSSNNSGYQDHTILNCVENDCGGLGHKHTINFDSIKPPTINIYIIKKIGR